MHGMNIKVIRIVMCGSVRNNGRLVNKSNSTTSSTVGEVEGKVKF